MENFFFFFLRATVTLILEVQDSNKLCEAERYSLSLVEEAELQPSAFLPTDQHSFRKAESVLTHVIFLSHRNLGEYGKLLLVFIYIEKYLIRQEYKQCHILDPKQWLPSSR